MMFALLLLGCTSSSPQESGETGLDDEGPALGDLFAAGQAVGCEVTPPDHPRDFLLFFWSVDRALRLTINVDGLLSEALEGGGPEQVLTFVGDGSGRAVLERWAGDPATLCDGTDELVFPEPGVESWEAIGGGGTMVFQISDADGGAGEVDVEYDEIRMDGWSIDAFSANHVPATVLP